VPREITLEIKNTWMTAILIILGCVFVLEVLLTLNSPIVFGDEGFHARMSQWIAENLEYPKYAPFYGSEQMKSGYYRQPLWEFLVSSFYLIFGFNDVFVKILTPFIGSILGGLTVFLLVKKIYGEKIGFLTSVMTVTMPSVVTYALLIYVDSLFWFYFSAFVLTFMLALEEDSKRYYFLSGLLGSLAFLTKLPGVFVPLLVFLVFLYQIFIERKPFSIWKKYLIVFIPLLLASTFVLRDFAVYGTACNLPFVPSIIKGECDVNNYTPKYEFSGRTEQTGTEASVFNIGIANYVNFAYGNLWLVPLGFFGGMLFLAKELNRKNIIILITLALFAFLMTRSEVNYRSEDAARYTLCFAPIIALSSSIFFANFYEFLEKNFKYFGLAAIVIVLVLAYLNFSDKMNAMKSVKQFSPSFFEACDWIKANTPQNSRIMTVWVHHTTYNCQRNVIGNVADMEMSQDLNFSIETAKKLGITHIFIQKFSLSNDYLSERYNINFVQFLENNPNCFKKIHETGPSLNDCISQGGCDGAIVYEVNWKCLE
jgi:4-amino-4-deoxy-L-arabinose transferase-like glycosyltransferase